MKYLDWVLVLSITPLLVAGLVTMRPFLGDESGYFFNRQFIWIVAGFLVFFVFGRLDWRFLKTSGLLFLLFLIAVLLLLALLIFGGVARGSSSWFNLYLFSIEPADPIKLLVILILSKYFSRRHVEIARFRHIFISSVYALVPALLIFFQPDFGSATVFVSIWFGMILVSGISKKQLVLVFLLFLLIFSTCWLFVLRPYQKERVMSFLDPMKDPRGSGYNALQSMIAIGSGEVWGKGVGFGTQSRLQFLPEYRTDFIFASFAEEWGFIGVLIVFICFGVLFYRILKNAYYGQTNFEKFYGIGLSIFLMTHLVLHTGMNIGILPVTGLSLPFLSYGGSHMLTCFAGLGILMGFNRHAQKFVQTEPVVEFLG